MIRPGFLVPFPTKDITDACNKYMNLYYNGAWRMDWGLGNSNKTATLPACSIAYVVVSSRFMQEDKVIANLNQGGRIILVNPSCLPEEAKLNNDLIGKTLVYFGEYSQATSRFSWSSYPRIKALQIDGASDFVPSWPQVILPTYKT